MAEQCDRGSASMVIPLETPTGLGLHFFDGAQPKLQSCYQAISGLIAKEGPFRPERLAFFRATSPYRFELLGTATPLPAPIAVLPQTALPSAATCDPNSCTLLSLSDLHFSPRLGQQKEPMLIAARLGTERRIRRFEIWYTFEKTPNGQHQLQYQFFEADGGAVTQQQAIMIDMNMPQWQDRIALQIGFVFLGGGQRMRPIAFVYTS